MTPEQQRGLPTTSPTKEAAPTPAEEAREARQEIIAMMREARPHSWQARAISHVVRWYGVVLPRENELPEDHYKRRYREKGRIELIMERHSERSPEYETERDFAMLLIEGYTTARLAEFKQHGATPAPSILQGLVAEELKDMKKLAKGENGTVIFTPSDMERQAHGGNDTPTSQSSEQRAEQELQQQQFRERHPHLFPLSTRHNNF